MKIFLYTWLVNSWPRLFGIGFVLLQRLRDPNVRLTNYKTLFLAQHTAYTKARSCKILYTLLKHCEDQLRLKNLTLSMWSKQSNVVSCGAELLSKLWNDQSEPTLEVGNRSPIRYNKLFIMKWHTIDFTVCPLINNVQSCTNVKWASMLNWDFYASGDFYI